MSFIIHRDIVHMSHPGFDLASETCTTFQVASEHGARQSEFTVVCQLESMCFAVSLLNAYERPKDFVPGNLHVRCDVNKHMRR